MLHIFCRNVVVPPSPWTAVGRGDGLRASALKPETKAEKPWESYVSLLFWVLTHKMGLTVGTAFGSLEGLNVVPDIKQMIHICTLLYPEGRTVLGEKPEYEQLHQFKGIRLSSRIPHPPLPISTSRLLKPCYQSISFPSTTSFPL